VPRCCQTKLTIKPPFPFLQSLAHCPSGPCRVVGRWGSLVAAVGGEGYLGADGFYTLGSVTQLLMVRVMGGWVVDQVLGVEVATPQKVGWACEVAGRLLSPKANSNCHHHAP